VKAIFYVDAPTSTPPAAVDFWLKKDGSAAEDHFTAWFDQKAGKE
jgi:hypothetical protein